MGRARVGVRRFALFRSVTSAATLRRRLAVTLGKPAGHPRMRSHRTWCRLRSRSTLTGPRRAVPGAPATATAVPPTRRQRDGWRPSASCEPQGAETDGGVTGTNGAANFAMPLVFGVHDSCEGEGRSTTMAGRRLFSRGRCDARVSCANDSTAVPSTSAPHRLLCLPCSQAEQPGNRQPCDITAHCCGAQFTWGALGADLDRAPAT